MNRLLHCHVLLCVVLAACGAPEVLEPRDGTVPRGVDLSGNWVMREIPPAERQRLREAIGKTDGVDDYGVFRRPPPPQGARITERSIEGGLVHVFLQTGTKLKVTQTPYALFISFDRSVVEEFRFGENRTVSVGAIEAQRVTGWEGDQLVVETLDENGMKLTERFWLTDGGKTLQRQITFRSKRHEEETIVQVFDTA